MRESPSRQNDPDRDDIPPLSRIITLALRAAFGGRHLAHNTL